MPDLQPDWDADSSALRTNLRQVLERIARAAALRERLTVESARNWQRDMLSGLAVPQPRYVGAFRGEPGLERTQVQVLSRYGTPAPQVAEELVAFEAKLQLLVAELDAIIPMNATPDADQLAAILDLCAWAHAEWVRIHPFANGNGRTARLWVNALAMRYGLPPFLRLRPRPNAGYAEAAARAMQGDWRPTAVVLRPLFQQFLDEL